MYRLRAHIEGIVQGVGFRPHVRRLASRFGLAGWVMNDSRGVTLVADSPDKSILEKFAQAIAEEAPTLSEIVSFQKEIFSIDDSEAFTKFEIHTSRPNPGERVLISPDVAVCADCLREMYDPSHRRYRYPFLNCTNCGPRFTIIKDVPYDRPMTTMAPFPMCEPCEAEYVDPTDRRFHAQPTCCSDCGPQFEFLDADGRKLDVDPINHAISLIQQGKTVAIKGIGGFHLACDALNADAVRRLRHNKHREAKPLAVMVGGISAARRLGEVSCEAEEELLSSARPIVIIPEVDDSPLPGGNVEGIWGVNGGVRTVGVMLPYAPLHHLLFRPLPIEPPSDLSSILLPEEIGGPPDAKFDAFAALVMTSGNISDEPIAIDNAEAITRLNGIADGYLVHDRDIFRRCDDSVVAIGIEGKQVWRMGRGYAPKPIFLSKKFPPILAVGPELKNNVCHTRDNKAFISPHVGDLKTFEAYEYFRETIAHQERILGVKPERVACDMHPDYMSTRWADESGLPVTKVQHHHAHVVALMAEHGMLDEKIIGLAMDGTGYGDDVAIWGGEILLCDATSYNRLGHFTYAPLPGGDTAVKEVWRSALGRLWIDGEGLPDEFRPLFAEVDPDKLALVENQIRADVNCPKVCSLGRLFDAAAFIAGLGPVAQYDGQLPMLLEAVCGMNYVQRGVDRTSAMLKPGYPFLLDGGRVLSRIASLRLRGKSTTELALFFHELVIDMLAEAVWEAVHQTGVTTIGLTGGCFMNRILAAGLATIFSSHGGLFKLLTHKLTPPNDGCISLGQAVVAGSSMFQP